MNFLARGAVSVLFLIGWLIVLATLAGCDQPETSGKSKFRPSANAKRDRNATQKADGQRASQDTKLPASDRSAVAPSGDSQAAVEKIDLTVPHGNAEELMAFIRKLDAVRLEEDTPEARAEFIRVQKAIIQGADQLLSKEGLKEETRFDAVALKWNASILLVNLDDEGAEQRFLAFANELAKDKNPALARTARVQLRQLEVMHKLRALLQGKTKESGKLVQDLEVMLGEEGLRFAQFDLVRQAARVLEALDKHEEATKVYSRMGQSFRNSNDPELAAQAAHTASQAAIRLGWIGKDAELAGTRLDGEKFDVDELKGKVVLVDFWATWCPPCLAELPNVVENYKKYHDRGFEIVGVSLDSDKDQLTRFVEGENGLREKLPWVTLFWSEAGEEADPYDNPLVKQFGVDGVPATFLVDQEGKVISLGARGERLGEMLAELLGAPDDTSEEGKEVSE